GWVFSPDGRFLAAPVPHRRSLVDESCSSSSRHLVVYETATGLPLAELRLKRPNHCCSSPDGAVLAVSDGHEVLLWDWASGLPVTRLQGQNGDIRLLAAVNSLASSPEGNYFLTSELDTSVVVWDWRRMGPRRVKSAPLSRADLEACWADLGAENGPRAYR